ncbi:MAG TPA: 2Fe-2S iron-sulfur cluster-binding protein [Saprospiraceae bacterium]|nr:2Fe-2S iron-sulfur cluster-binding protein [Saprospiraceae bacterium]
MNQIRIDVYDREGISHSLEIPTGIQMNIMELCKAYDMPVEGICGGMALCASCQIYVESPHELPPVSQDEEAMLSEAFHVQKNSRLGCQIPIYEKLDGLVVRLAPE